jgi:hypothetical protein
MLLRQDQADYIVKKEGPQARHTDGQFKFDFKSKFYIIARSGARKRTKDN